MSSEKIVSINYKNKNDSTGLLSQHETVADAVSFIRKNIKKENIEYIGLSDGNGHQTIGYDNIISVFERNCDLWNGDKTCIHPVTGSGSGGGLVCKSCSAWFCY